MIYSRETKTAAFDIHEIWFELELKWISDKN